MTFAEAVPRATTRPPSARSKGVRRSCLDSRRARKELTAVVAAVAVLLVTACSGTPAPGTAAASTPATDTPVPGGSASPASGSPSPTGTVRLRYSETYRWPDGLRIRVDEPVDYWPSGWVRTVTASRGAGYADLRFTG